MDGQPPLPFHGIINCRVYVPFETAQSLHNIGFLPYRCEQTEKSYIFTCKQCFLKRNQTEVCRCKREDASWYGSYFSNEIIYAIGLQYEIDMLSFFGYTKQSKILSRWMSIIAHQKLRFTQHPCRPEELNDYLKFINDQSGFESEALRLTPEKLNPNDSMKTASKLLMNSAIGKFGQMNLRNSSRFIYSDKELNQIFADDSITVQNVSIISENCLLVNTQSREEKLRPSLSTNFYVSGCISSGGRIYMDRLLRLVLKAKMTFLYCDTDGYLALKYKDQPPIEWLYHDAVLGGLKSEIPPGFYIAKVDFLGAKSYAITYKNRQTGEEKVSLKLKGINLPQATTHQTLKQEAFHDLLSPERAIKVPQMRFKIDKRELTITPAEQWKIIKSTVDKRFSVNGYNPNLLHGYGCVDFSHTNNIQLLEALEAENRASEASK